MTCEWLSTRIVRLSFDHIDDILDGETVALSVKKVEVMEDECPSFRRPWPLNLRRRCWPITAGGAAC